MDDIVPLNEDPSELKVFPDSLSDSAAMFEIRSGPSEYNMLL